MIGTSVATHRQTDVLILGGGVIGLCTAYYLLQAGRSVRVLERGRVGAATSFGNCGTLTPSHAPPLAAPGMIAKALKWMLTPDAPLYVKPRLDPTLWRWLMVVAARCNDRDWRASAQARLALLELSRDHIERLVADERLDCEFEASGLLDVYATEQGLQAAQRRLPLLQELGLPSRTLSPHALLEAEPALKPGMAGAIEWPRDAVLRPDRFCAEMARVVRGMGGEIEEGVEVSALAEGGIARSAQGNDFRGRQLVIALGPWSAPFLRPLGLALPIQPGKGYSMTYARPALCPRRPMVLKERSVCVTAWTSGFRLGSTMEFSGYDDSLNRRRLDALERGASEYLLQPTGPRKIEEWYGWRPMSQDDVPLIGAMPGAADTWLATGHGMMGMSMSAGSGRLLADLICAREPVIDPRPFDPHRFPRLGSATLAR